MYIYNKSLKWLVIKGSFPISSHSVWRKLSTFYTFSPFDNAAKWLKQSKPVQAKKALQIPHKSRTLHKITHTHTLLPSSEKVIKCFIKQVNSFLCVVNPQTFSFSSININRESYSHKHKKVSAHKNKRKVFFSALKDWKLSHYRQ